MKLGMIITGGGTRAISELLQYGGASEFFSFADVPYSKESTDSVLVLRKTIDKYGCINTSNDLCHAALVKLIYLHGWVDDMTAIGCSAVLYKHPQREGRDNVAFITRKEYFAKTNKIRTTEIGIKFEPWTKYDGILVTDNRLIQEVCLGSIIVELANNRIPEIVKGIQITHMDWSWMNA